ncbi:MAG: hypothetical protein KBS40_03870, partial [Bacteroidales bacterium]|nr:hypothetical protein [Bacteroidales bacterium]
VTFKVAVKGYEGLKPVGESDTLKVTEEAYYQFYLKLIYGGDELYVVKLEEPADEGFGIIVNGTEKIKGQKNEKQIEFVEYITVANLTAGATFQLYDFGNKVPWTETNIDQASTPNVIINTDNVYEVTSDGKYTIYLKMYGPEDNQVYIAYDGTGTALEAIMLNGGLKKFMLDGQMYILRNNHLFNAAGNLLK